MRVVFAAARSSPGVTTATLACASVWPSDVLVVEASEDGGALAARFGLGFEPGLTTLAAAARHDGRSAQVGEHVQVLPGADGRISALVAPAAMEPAQMLWRTAASRIATLLDDVEASTTVLIDAGRLSAAPLAVPLLAGADRFVVVCRPRLEELQALAHRLAVLGGFGPCPELVLIGDTPYGPAEVADALGLPVLGVLARDVAAADALSAVRGVRGLARSRLLRTATGIVAQLTSAPAPAVAPTRIPTVDGGVAGSRGPARLFTASRP